MLAYNDIGIWLGNQMQFYFVVIVKLVMPYLWWYCSMCGLLLVLELSEKQINQLLTNIKSVLFFTEQRYLNKFDSHV